ncbi:MAG TPA: pilin [Candidatus Dormibacteraeota bacterium]|nr:pilin [Candidatus Dormibacteraeota bacterium]
MKNTTSKVLRKTAEAGVYFSTFIPAAALGQDAACDPNSLTIGEGADCAKGTSNTTTLFGEGGTFQQIANILIFLIGAIAVIMLILGGLQYVISNGDPKKVESAKNTILYAIIGIVVAILAFAIVGFVTGQLAPAA